MEASEYCHFQLIFCKTDPITSMTSGTTNEQRSEYNIAIESSSSSSSLNNTSRDMLDEIEETFNITNPSSINTSFRPTSQDFFSSTLDEFRNLTLNNIADDSSDDNDDNDNNDDDTQ